MNHVKQIIIVRNDLRDKLRHGKLAAQVAHASMGVFLNGRYLDGNRTMWVPLSLPAEEWITGAFTKVVLRADDLDHMMELKAELDDLTIPTFVIRDAGRTVFAEPTITCMGVGPWWSDELDPVLSHLKMY